MKLPRLAAPLAAAALAAALAACETPLCRSARRGDTAALQAASGASDGEKKKALYCAVDSGSADGVRALLAQGAPIGAFSMERARDGRPEILALLRQEQARRDSAAEKAHAKAPAPVPAEAPSDVDAPAYSGAARPGDAALLIGVDGFGPHDADAVAAHLRALGYPADRVLVLTGEAASRLAVLKALDARLPPLAGAGSAVTFYFSGRTAAGKDGSLYMLTADSDPAYLEDSALPLSRLYARLAALKARRVTAVLEAPVPAAAPPPPAGMTVLAASEGHAAQAYAEKRHGLFTYHLLKALTAGKRTASALLEAAKPAVAEESARLGAPQTPRLLGPDAPL